MATGINLSGRIPAIVKPISGKVFIVGIGLALFLIGAVVFGFCYRIKRQERMKEAQQTLTVASDASTSNREQIEGGQPAPPTTLSGLPIGTSQNTNGKTADSSFAPAGNAANQKSFPAYQPSYYPASPVTPVDGPEQLRAQALSRQMEREQQAREAPTGVQEQRTIGGQANPSPELDDLARINSMAPPSSPAVYPTSAPPVGAPGLAENEGAGGFRSQNDQTGKRQFGEGGEGAGDDYLKTTRTAPLSPWVVQRGTVIPAALPNKIVSDLPGDLIAEVVRDVYDSPSQKYVEIPAGSRLVGEYNSSVSYGQNRVQIVWTAVYFPDGSFIDLDRMPSHASDGSAGLRDQTDNHWKRVVAGVALSSILSAGLQLSQNRTNGSVLNYPSTGQVIASGVGTQASQLGEQLINRNLNVQPTLKIRPGELFAVSVKKDIIFPGPYEPLATK